MAGTAETITPETITPDRSRFQVNEGERPFLQAFTRSILDFKERHSEREIGAWFRLNNTALKTSGSGDTFATVETMDTQDRATTKIIYNFSPHNIHAPVEFIQKAQGLEISLQYGSLDENGNAALFDQHIATKFLEDNGSIYYAFSERKIGRVRGVDLEIGMDEEESNVIIKEYPGAKGFVFPISFNINQQLNKFIERFDVLASKVGGLIYAQEK